MYGERGAIPNHGTQRLHRGPIGITHTLRSQRIYIICDLDPFGGRPMHTLDSGQISRNKVTADIHPIENANGLQQGVGCRF